MKNYHLFKTKEQIAGELGICVKTLNKHLKREGIFIPRGLIDPKSQLKILSVFGIEENNQLPTNEG
jgi:hypothetical protein